MGNSSCWKPFLKRLYSGRIEAGAHSNGVGDAVSAVQRTAGAAAGDRQHAPSRADFSAGGGYFAGDSFGGAAGAVPADRTGSPDPARERERAGVVGGRRGLRQDREQNCSRLRQCRRNWPVVARWTRRLRRLPRRRVGYRPVDVGAAKTHLPKMFELAEKLRCVEFFAFQLHNGVLRYSAVGF